MDTITKKITENVTENERLYQLIKRFLDEKNRDKLKQINFNEYVIRRGKSYICDFEKLYEGLIIHIKKEYKISIQQPSSFISNLQLYLVMIFISKSRLPLFIRIFFCKSDSQASQIDPYVLFLFKRDLHMVKTVCVFLESIREYSSMALWLNLSSRILDYNIQEKRVISQDEKQALLKMCDEIEQIILREVENRLYYFEGEGFSKEMKHSDAERMQSFLDSARIIKEMKEKVGNMKDTVYRTDLL